MLNFIRNSAKGWASSIIILLLIFTFALWGIQGYLHNHQGESLAAKVNGEPLLTAALEQAYQEDKQHWLLTHKTHAIDNATSKQLRNQSLTVLTQQMALTQAAKALGYRALPEWIAQIIQATPEFQQDKQFSPELFQRFLSQMHYQANAFFNRIANALLIHQVNNDIISTSFILPKELEQIQQFSHEKRRVDYIILPTTHFHSHQPTFSKQQITRYYHQHPAQFSSPARAWLDYIVLPAQRAAKALPKEKQSLLAKNQAELLAELSYTQAHSLNAVADRLHLKIQHSAEISAISPPDAGILHSATAIQAAFSDNVLHKGYNSPVITLKNGDRLVLRVAKKVPAGTLPLAQAKQKIITALTKQAAQQHAHSTAQRWVKQLIDKKISWDNLRQQTTWGHYKQLGHITRHNTSAPTAIIETAFHLYHQQATAIQLDSGDMAIIRAIRLPQSHTNKPHKKLSQLKQHWQNALGSLAYSLYRQAILSQADIKLINT